ncbi:hypothetical protein K443DRAFT_82734, partial [Laccaria amethystina LaAM-08-1]
HSHGLKWMFMYKQEHKVKFQIWSTIMHTAVKLILDLNSERSKTFKNTFKLIFT